MERYEAQEELENAMQARSERMREDSFHCPECNSLGVHTPLGTLGDLDWFRCRFCGFDFFDDITLGADEKGPYAD